MISNGWACFGIAQGSRPQGLTAFARLPVALCQIRPSFQNLAGSQSARSSRVSQGPDRHDRAVASHRAAATEPIGNIVAPAGDDAEHSHWQPQQPNLVNARSMATAVKWPGIWLSGFLAMVQTSCVRITIIGGVLKAHIGRLSVSTVPQTWLSVW